MTTDVTRNEESLQEDVEALTVKRLLVRELIKVMKDQHKTKLAMARELRTSRAYLDRVLDPQHTTVSLRVITRAASVLGKRVSLTIF
jgi:hypothetical protein